MWRNTWVGRGAKLCIGIASGIAALCLVAGRSHAAWEAREFESPLGDRARGIAQPAAGDPGFVLIVGCDGERGDRWRGVTILQPPSATPPRLEDPAPGMALRQRARVAMPGRPAAPDLLNLHKTPAGGRLYWVGEPSKFVGDMLAAEKASPVGDVSFELRLANGQPLDLRFPLAGFSAAFADLSKQCRDWQPIGGPGAPGRS